MATRATLEHVLTEPDCEHMIVLATRHPEGVQEALDDYAAPWVVVQLGARADYRFCPEVPRNGNESCAAHDGELDEHPGQASPRMTQSVTPEMMPGGLRLIWPVFNLMTRPDGGKSAAKAARSSIHLASSPSVEGVNGEYRDSKCEVTPWPKPSSRRRRAGACGRQWSGSRRRQTGPDGHPPRARLAGDDRSLLATEVGGHMVDDPSGTRRVFSGIPPRLERGRHGVPACRDLRDAAPTLHIVAAAGVFTSG